MMTSPNKEADLPSYVQSTVLPPSVPQPNGIPITLQWNVRPVPAGPNGYPVWNPSSNQPQIITPNGMHQWNVQPAPTSYVTSAVLPQDPQLGVFHQVFLKGKPYALGIVLIVTAILQIIFGISLGFLVVSTTLISGVQFWGPVFYIIAGSLSISAYKKPNVCKVKGTLALSIISSISSMIGFIINIVDFCVIDCDEFYYHCSDDHASSGVTVISFLLVMNLLVFCVTVSLAVFGCRAVDQAPASSPPQMFVIQNDVVFSMPPSAYPVQGSEVPSLQPPAYAPPNEYA